MRDHLTLIGKRAPVLGVVDSWIGALQTYGLDPNVGVDIERWRRSFLEPVRSVCPATLTSRPVSAPCHAEGRGFESLHPRGFMRIARQKGAPASRGSFTVDATLPRDKVRASRFGPFSGHCPLGCKDAGSDLFPLCWFRRSRPARLRRGLLADPQTTAKFLGSEVATIPARRARWPSG